MRRLVAVEVETTQLFRDDPVRAMRRHWVCECGGEMRSTGRGMTTMDTSWEHCCDKCGVNDWASKNYPCIVYLPEAAR